MGQLAYLDDARRKRPAKPHPMPMQFGLHDAQRLMRRAMKLRFTIEELRFACETVFNWQDGRGAKAWRVDWVAVVINSLRNEWGLRGFDKYAARRNLRGRGQPITERYIIERIRVLRDQYGRT